jgi:hypothetical protein
MSLPISTSFVQDKTHLTKSARFVTVQPSAIAEVLKDHGFDLVGLKTGKGRKEDRLNHQTTIARYRSTDNFMAESGLFMDIMFKIPHLTGKLEARLGFFRGVCANQWNAGKLFEIIRLAHIGNVLNELNDAIPSLVMQRKDLIETIRMMQARDVSAPEMAQLAQATSQARMLGIDGALAVQPQDLLIPRRLEDRASDLFTVTNVLQENAQRFGIRYQTQSLNKDQQLITRNMVSRKVNENSVRAIELNASIWDAASQLLTA